MEFLPYVIIVTIGFIVAWLLRGQVGGQQAQPPEAPNGEGNDGGEAQPPIAPGLRDARDAIAMLAAMDAPSASPNRSNVEQTFFMPLSGGGFSLNRVRPRGDEDGGDDEGHRVADSRAFDAVMEAAGVRTADRPTRTADRGQQPAPSAPQAPEIDSVESPDAGEIKITFPAAPTGDQLLVRHRQTGETEWTEERVTIGSTVILEGVPAASHEVQVAVIENSRRSEFSPIQAVEVSS